MREILNWRDAKRVSEICVVAPTQKLAEEVCTLIDQKHYREIDVVVATGGRQEIVDCGRALSEKGAKIIITRKGTKSIFEETTALKVVGLNYTLSDYLWMLKERGIYTPGLVAFFSYDPLGQDVLQMCEMLGVQAKNYIFKNFADCKTCVEGALRDGAVFSVGGAWTDPWSKKLGLPHVILENSEGTILTALENAIQLRRVQLEEAEKQQRFKTQMEMYQAVLNFTHDAILAIDENGRVQVLNPPAERIMGCRAADSVGQPVEAILPNTLLPEVLESGEKQLDQIMQIHQTLCNTNRIPILVDGQRRGVVATFQDVKQLQNSEQKIRLKLHEKGLVAKYAFNDILGDSPAIRSTIQIAQSYAASRASVLILGETGTGKELFAQSIHNASDRRDGPFVAINCAAVSNSLLESELFGYEAGSFTGASRGGREGVFELAHGGTLFLDERCDPGVEKVTANQMIYGHDMHDGTMFGKLHLYAGEDYGKEHSLIRFDTLHEVGEYQLLAAFYTQVYYTTDTCFKYYQFFDAENEEEFNDYVENVKALAEYDTGVSAEFGDTLITLSTCSDHVENGRFVVVAKKVN